MERLEICPVRQTEAPSVPELKEMENFCCHYPCMQIRALQSWGVCVQYKLWEKGAYNQL